MNNYHIYRNKQDIGKRIRYLHSEEPLSIALIASIGDEVLSEAISYYETTFSSPIYVLLYEELGKITELRLEFPSVSFIVFTQPVSVGAMVNVLANECYTTYFFVTRSDLRVTQFEYSSILDQFNKNPKPALVTPCIVNKGNESIPVVQVPRIEKHLIDPIPFFPDKEKEATLYPYLGLGVYERALFQRLRGFDELIQGEYWQFLDFGIRCWLFGYSIFTLSFMQVQFPYRQLIIENRSETEGVKRVLTKALGVRQVNGKNYIKKIGSYTDKGYMKHEMNKRLALYKCDFFELMNDWVPPTVEELE
ncbi:MAG: hypothetical protein EOM67_06130 [Spirochaetia bacterium]|nr:hypothetical protein [Spirochaetia bacterium]